MEKQTVKVELMMHRQTRLTPVAEDLLNHAMTAQANAAQHLLLDLTQEFGLSLAQVALQSKVGLEVLAALLAGTMGEITLPDYDKLLCLYCFKQTQRKAASSKLVSDWRRFRGGALSISRNSEPKTIRVKSESTRLYITDTLYLTKREQQVAYGLLSGLSTHKKIGAYLNLSERTIEFYMANMRAKLGCKKRKDLIQKLHSIAKPWRTHDN